MTLLAGRLAVVTGASRGIGLATARALQAQGARVVRLARSLADGSQDGFLDLGCDLADVAATLRAAARVLEQWGVPDLLVNNAGRFQLKPFEETDPAELDRQYAVNVRAPFVLARAFLPAMRRSGQGIVVSIGSTCDHLAFPENSAYTATKFGLRGLHEALAAEYQGSGIRFTLISPGSTDTDIWEPFDPEAREGFLARAEMLRPEDVAEAVVFAATRPPGVTLEWLRIAPTPPRVSA
ncbi:MAG TPA: SDR family oxidoreductase [Gemmatimonadales bacterium]|jgi:NAD(P)-dependent dehydrogenase (short-subunit alcohol dehydrogenase family)|nr:SDR family oxidoreductase [Gemmatimonadales bacterium]